jgi:hypothetical protein
MGSKSPALMGAARIATGGAAKAKKPARIVASGRASNTGKEK